MTPTRKNRNPWRKPCLSATFSPQSPHRSARHRGERSATNRLNHDTQCELTSDMKMHRIQPGYEGMYMDRRRLALMSEKNVVSSELRITTCGLRVECLKLFQ